MDNPVLDSQNTAITGVISATATSTTFNSTDNIIDSFTNDLDSLTLSVEADVTANNSALVRGIETINVNANATTLTDTALDVAATNFSNVKTYNFDVTKAASAVNTVNVTAMASNNATVNATDKFSTVTVAGSTGNALTVDAKAAGTSGSATAVTVTGAMSDVTITGAGFLTATSNASTGLLSATAAKNLTLSGTAAQVISATSTGGNVTVSDATASVNTTVTATGDVTVSKLDASGKVTVTSGGVITLNGSTAAGTDLNTTSATLSGVGTSTIGDADLMTSLNISGNNAAATYDMTAGAAELADVGVSGASNVTLKLNASQVETTSAALNVADTGAGTFTLELKTGAGNVDLRGGDLVDKLLVNVDNNAKTVSVKSGQAVTYKVDQTATTVAVGSAANAASNTVTIKLDDEARDTAAVDIGTSLTVTQAKTVTIDGSIDTTSGGAANTHSIKTIDASAANANVTINMGINNLDLANAGATTVGTGTITVTGSGTLTDAATVTSLTAATLDASAMTGAVTLNSTTALAVGTIKTGSAADTIILTDNIDTNVQTGLGNDTVTLDNASTANKATSIDLGDGTSDTLKFVSGSQLLKGTGTVALAGVENIQFANSGTQEIQAALLSTKTYAISNAATAATNDVGVIVGSTDTTVDLSALVGSTAVETSVAAMTFTTDANANTAAITIKGIANGKNIITGSSVGGDNLVGGAKDDVFNYSSAALLFSANAMLDTVSGGTGTDSIKLTATASDVTVAAADSWANATSVEKITTGANTGAISLTLGATAQTAGITTIDLSGDSNTTGVNVVNVSAFTTGATVTGSLAGGVDNITGGSGADTFVYKATADLAAGNAFIDSIVGGDGTDIIQLGWVHPTTPGSDTAAVLANTDVFTRVSGVETIKAVATTAAETVELDVTAYAAGIRTVDLSAAKHATGNVIDAAEITGGGMTLIGSATGITNITGGTGADTMSGGSADDVFAGGQGNDVISLSAGGTDTVTLVAHGTSGYDTVSNFTSGANTVTGFDKVKTIAGDGALVDAASIASNAVAVVAEKVTEFNLIFSGTGLATSLDGTALFAALQAINGGTAVTLTQTAGAGVDGAIVAYQDGNAYVYTYSNAANDGITAAEMQLSAVLTGVSAGSLHANNFIV